MPKQNNPSAFWKSYEKADKNDYHLSQRLFGFLLAQKELYEQAKEKPDIMALLDLYQIEALRIQHDQGGYVDPTHLITQKPG